MLKLNAPHFTLKIMASTPELTLTDRPDVLTAQLVDIPSPSWEEAEISRRVFAALTAHFPAASVYDSIADYQAGTETAQVEIIRDEHRIIARTNRSLPQRVVLAGHLDTVPIADNVPSSIITADGQPAQIDDEGARIFGCGSVDMKAGDAVFISCFAELATSSQLTRDITLVLYDKEEIAAEHNGLKALVEKDPQLVHGDFAILGEPTGGLVEAGCQGTLRIRVHVGGTRAHSARSWLGDNAIHHCHNLLAKLAAYQPRTITIDGCEYREGMQAVALQAGVAGNVVPDHAWMDINFRFAPDRTAGQALHHVLDYLELPQPTDHPDQPRPAPGEVSVQLTDTSDGALPRLSIPAAAEFIAGAGLDVRAKYGWTDVSRFASLNMAAVNCGPGDSGYAHKRDEQCDIAQIWSVYHVVKKYLTS